jgi:hypothetical protein
MNQVIGQAGPTLALARQALGGNGAARPEPAPGRRDEGGPATP